MLIKLVPEKLHTAKASRQELIQNVKWGVIIAWHSCQLVGEDSTGALILRTGGWLY